MAVRFAYSNLFIVLIQYVCVSASTINVDFIAVSLSIRNVEFVYLRLCTLIADSSRSRFEFLLTVHVICVNCVSDYFFFSFVRSKKSNTVPKTAPFLFESEVKWLIQNSAAPSIFYLNLLTSQQRQKIKICSTTTRHF